MSNELPVVPLHEQLDPTTPAYINAKLWYLEQRFDEFADLMKPLEDAVDDAEEAHNEAKAHAELGADGKTAAKRDAQVFLATAETRRNLAVAKAALSYAKNKARGWSEAKSSLQTRKKDN